ncbi:MAG: type II secretion system protein GspM [Mariprofundaceae bacterium]|nr:type II secretion system protein GspM [Mariprofundaceae bacterium]
MSNPLVVRVQGEVRERYSALQAREQRIVLIAAVLLPLMVIVFGFWLPLRDRVQVLEASVPGFETQLSEAQQLAVRAGKNAGKAVARGDLLSTVEQQARAAKVRRFITRIKPMPGTNHQRVLVQLRKARYADVVQFLAKMAGQGVSSSRVKISNAGPRNGLVDVDVSFLFP